MPAVETGTLPSGVAPKSQVRVECLCAGDPRTMGLAQGSELKGKIQAAREMLRDLDGFRLEQPWWLPYPLFLSVAERKVERMLLKILRESNPGMLERLEGIAEGSGLALRSVLLMNAVEALMVSLEGRVTMAPFGACSALAVRGAKSLTGEPVIAKNFDYLPLIQPFYILREGRPQGGFRSLEFAVAPQAGTVDGVNEKGLAITLNYAFVTDRGTPNPLITMLIGDALATCASVEEAVRRIGSAQHWGAGMLMLADAAGDMASLELSNTRAAVRRPEGNEDWLLFTNVCHCADTRAVQVPENALYSDTTPAALRGTPILRPHALRARRIEHLVRSLGAVGQEELAAIMSDHGEGGVPSDSSPCVHSKYFATTAALQWFPARRSVRVSYTFACSAQYVEIGL